MKVYIAGPMTGKPLYNFPAFDKATAEWEGAGWDVVSPAEMTRIIWRETFGREFDPATTDTSAADYRMFMRADLLAVMDVDALALLDGWEKSRGASLEVAVASIFGKKFYLAESRAEVMPDVLLRVGLPTEESVLQEAQRLVHGDRGASYGHPYYDYRCTGKMWSALLEHWLHGIGFLGDAQEFPTIPPRIATEMMIAVKLSREMNKGKRDNRTDTAGYAECAQMIADLEAGQ